MKLGCFKGPVSDQKETIHEWVKSLKHCLLGGGGGWDLFLLTSFESICPLRDITHCNSVQSSSDWSYDETSLSWWTRSLPHPYSSLNDLLWMKIKQVMLQLAESPDIGRFWREVLDSALHHHSQHHPRAHLLEEWCLSLEQWRPICI